MKKSAYRFVCVWLVLLGSLILDPAQAAAPVSVQTFFSYPKVSEVKISPDGKHVAIVVADGQTGMNRKELMIMDVATHKTVPCFRTSSDEIIANYWWANSSRLLVTTADQTGSKDRPVMRGELYAINTDGSQRLQLMGPQFQGNVGSAPTNTHYVALIFVGLLYQPVKDAHDVVVESFGGPEGLVAYNINIYSGKFFKVTDSPREGFDLLADNDGVIRLAYGNTVSTGEATFFYRDSGHDLDWKNMEKLYEKADPAMESVGPIAFTPDNKSLYWWGRTPTETLGLYELNPVTLKKTLLFGDPENDVQRIIWSMDWQPTQKAVAVLTMPGGPNLHVLDAKSQKVQYLIQLFHAFPGQMVDITSNSRDKQRMIVHVYSDKDPGAYYLFDTATKHVDLLFKSMPDIDPAQMASMTPVTFKARDGLLLHGYLTLPPGSNGKNLPMILNPHGGPHGVRDEWGWNPEAQFFANHGYAFLQVNFRGSSGYGMKYQDLGYRHWGTTMQSDLADAVLWAEKQGYADPKRVCIYGASYGGYAALENSILYPDLYKCTVGYVGAYDLTLMRKANFASAAYRDKALNNYLSVVVGDDEDALKAESPVYQVDKIKDPLFLVYGGADKTVAPENTEELMKALFKRGFHYDKMYEPKEMHGFTKPEHNFELYTRMLAFFNQYIGPDATKH